MILLIFTHQKMNSHRPELFLDTTRKVLISGTFIQMARDFPRRSIIEATLTSLRVEE